MGATQVAQDDEARTREGASRTCAAEQGGPGGRAGYPGFSLAPERILGTPMMTVGIGGFRWQGIEAVRTAWCRHARDMEVL
jgi:hypothetical protein